MEWKKKHFINKRFDSGRKKTCDCNIIHHDKVKIVSNNLPDDELLLSMSDFYKALSDSTRIKILAALSIGELCVCDISSLLNMTKSAVSHQLQNLRDINLIKSRKEGKEVIYSLADEHVREVFEISKEHVLEALYEQKG